MVKVLQFHVGRAMTVFMNFISRNRRGGFSLVELLLVIVIMAIIMALVTLSGASIRSSNAQTEAKQLVRSLQLLRSAWLACYADTYQMPATDADLRAGVQRYSDRIWDEEERKYGNMTVRVDNNGQVRVGFSGPWNLPSQIASAKNVILDTVDNWKSDYDITLDRTNGRVLIRVR